MGLLLLLLRAASTQRNNTTLLPLRPGDGTGDEEEEDDDDDYWARYDNTPARTPAVKRSPAAAAGGPVRPQPQASGYRASSAEDAYYAQYDSVQPAMDNHDPDEAAAAAAAGVSTAEESELNETQGAWTLAECPEDRSSSATAAAAAAATADEEEERLANLVHPRPASASSHSSNASLTVAKLEESAEKRDQSEFGVKQHVSRSIKSLFMLSRASGIDREEFERLVKTELDLLGMMEE